MSRLRDAADEYLADVAALGFKLTTGQTYDESKAFPGSAHPVEPTAA
jgi:hypothetical protein